MARLCSKCMTCHPTESSCLKPASFRKSSARVCKDTTQFLKKLDQLHKQSAKSKLRIGDDTRYA